MNMGFWVQKKSGAGMEANPYQEESKRVSLDEKPMIQDGELD
jgi:hypothetical protein